MEKSECKNSGENSEQKCYKWESILTFADFCFTIDRKNGHGRIKKQCCCKSLAAIQGCQWVWCNIQGQEARYLMHLQVEAAGLFFFFTIPPSRFCKKLI